MIKEHFYYVREDTLLMRTSSNLTQLIGLHLWVVDISVKAKQNTSQRLKYQWREMLSDVAV